MDINMQWRIEMYLAPSNKKPVHLVKHLHQVPEKKRVWPCIGDVKYDGVYAYGLMTVEGVKIYSRTGMEYFSLDHLKSEIAALIDTRNVLIFEVYHFIEKVNVISGWCRDQKAQHPGLFAIVHDLIPYNDFVEGVCTISYIERKTQLRKEINQYKHKLLLESESFYIRNEEEANTHFDKYTKRGEEGIIGRNPQGIWIAGKKNADAWKMKIELSYDLEVIGMEEGKGKYTGTLGVLLCRFRLFGKSDGELCVIRCSGMTDKQRDEWWLANHTDTVMDFSGTIVKVDAMCFTKNGLLREPRFKEVRADKVKADF